jgi:hypothetical protein
LQGKELVVEEDVHHATHVCCRRVELYATMPVRRRAALSDLFMPSYHSDEHLPQDHLHAASFFALEV